MNFHENAKENATKTIALAANSLEKDPNVLTQLCRKFICPHE